MFNKNVKGNHIMKEQTKVQISNGFMWYTYIQMVFTVSITPVKANPKSNTLITNHLTIFLKKLKRKFKEQKPSLSLIKTKQKQSVNLSSSSIRGTRQLLVNLRDSQHPYHHPTAEAGLDRMKRVCGTKPCHNLQPQMTTSRNRYEIPLPESAV